MVPNKTIDATVEQISTSIMNSIHETFKSAITSKLREQANKIVAQVADEIARDLTLKVDTIIGPPNGQPWGTEVRVILKLNEKDVQEYQIEKSVKVK